MSGTSKRIVPARDEFAAIFVKLKSILKRYERRSIVDRDTATEYYLNSKKLDAKKKPIFFAAVSINKATVSYYLLAVHRDPDLAHGISPDLRRRLHGKCCFRFANDEPVLFKELAALTKRSVANSNKAI